MKTDIARVAMRTGLVLILSAQMIASSSPEVWAQRRQAEPEANPQFQQQVQAPPLNSRPVSAPIEEPGASPAPVPRAMEGVQIGATAPVRQSAPAVTTALETRVTVRVKGAPLATFLDTISAQARVNFIITEGLESKRVTAFLQNVTVREALQVLLEIKGLTYQQVGKSNTYIVMPRSKTVENVITRIYNLSYIPLIPLGSASSEQASITPTASANGSGFGSGNSAGAGGLSSERGSSNTSGVDSKNSDVQIINVLRSVLTKSGMVTVEPRTNSLIVTDVPEVFPQVEQIIAELDKKAPQVLIEAQIVEIDSSLGKDLGFDWGGANGELASFTGGQRDTSFPFNLGQNLSNTHFFDPLAGVISSIGSTSGGSGSGTTGSNPALLTGSYIKTSILDLTSLSITLKALVSRSEARFLGKPKIMTLNNKSAIIQVATSQAVGVQQQTSSGGSAISQTVSGAERYETGLVLRVTPQVNREGYITMLVQPSYTSTIQSSISSTNNPVFDPVSRGASTLVRIKNGQTLVLGGLLQSTESKVVRKVPFLGYIPLIGWLFTSESTRRTNSDLVIFITPTIVSD